MDSISDSPSMKSIIDEIESFQLRLEHDPELKDVLLTPEGLVKKLREWEFYDMLKLDLSRELGPGLGGLLESLERIKETNIPGEEQSIAAALKRAFYSANSS
jgi:hypothetical protein